MRGRSLFLAALIAGWTSILGADTHPNTARGFDIGKPYQMNGLDNVNLFNGNLTVTIPIGQRYHVNGNLSYGLTLVYSGNVWDSVTNDPNQCFNDSTYPNRRSNAGLGWLLSLGRLFPKNEYPVQESQNDNYETPDGALHEFHPGLHNETSPDATYQYTRDGSYIRMKNATDQFSRTIEFPDGTYQVFARKKRPDSSQGDPEAGYGAWIDGGHWRLVSINDRFGNSATVSYSSEAAASPYPEYPEIWTIADGVRTQKVYFKVSPHSADEIIADRVVLSTFGGTGTWQFSYVPQTLGVGAANHQCSGTNNTASNVPLLTSVASPSIGNVSQTYSMLNPDGSGNAYYMLGTSVNRLNGHLRGIQLPTKGWLEWDYENFDKWNGSLPINHSVAVTTRRMKAADRALAHTSTWTYARGLSTNPTCFDTITQHTVTAPSEQLVVSVTSPEQVTSVHYFSTWKADYEGCSIASNFGEDEYSLPFSRGTSQTAGSHTLYLSQETFIGTPPSLATSPGSYRVSGGTRVRSEWAAYVFDGASAAATDGNFRETAHATFFEDDQHCAVPNTCYASVSRYGFDDAGHFRQTSTGGNFPKDASDHGNFKTTFTKYPNLSVTGTWLLNLFTDRCVADETAERTTEITQCSTLGSSAFTSQSCFDSTTGFLKRTRALSGSILGSHDLLAVYTQSSGNVTREDYYGGDNQSVNTDTADLCALGLPTASVYTLLTAYSNGSLATSKYSPDPGFFNVNNTDINANTGLVHTSDDPAGLTTTYDYDVLGRIKQVAAPGEAAINYAYTEATASGTTSFTPAQGTVAKTSPAAGTIQATTIFDDFGRVSKEQKLLPAGTASRETRYTGSGWTERVSEWEATPSHFTVFSNFDAFGRAGKIKNPSQTDDTATIMTYFGSRQVQRVVHVGDTLTTSGVQQSTATTTETYDRLGRLIQVDEPDGVSSTAYEHDAADRLTNVSMTAAGITTPQTRTFTYDGRGFLISEVHPENGTTSYGSYDARGHVGRKLAGASYSPFDLRYDYDAAERLTTVYQLLNRIAPPDPAHDTKRALKQFTFATANDGANYRQGKLETATRTNYSPLGAIDVKETYAYSDSAGRLTDKTTEVTGLQKFTQKYTYNDLGLFSEIKYPWCPNGNCATTSSMISSVLPTYQNGLLKTVPNFMTNITYDLNGMVTQIDHPSTVNDTITVDSNKLARPARIQFNTYDSCVSPQITLPNSQQVAAGSPPSLQITVVNAPTQTWTYQWLKDGTIIQGETGSSCCTATASSGTYTGRLVNSCGKGEATTPVTVCGNPIVTVAPSSAPYSGTAVTLTATLSDAPNGCGPFTYQWYIGDSGNTTTQTGTNSPSLSVFPNQTTHYWLRVTNNLGQPGNSNTAIVTVSTPLSTPGPLTATFNPATNTVTVSWGASQGAHHYQLERLDHGALTPSDVYTTNPPPYSLSANTTYVFHVRAVDSNGGSASSWTANDLATTMTFASLQNGVTTVAFDHFEQIRTAINAVRGANNAAARSWRDILNDSNYPQSIPTPDHNVGIYAAHILALRNAMDTALAMVQVATSGYTDSLTSPTPIRKVHITDLQQRAQ
jgi:YD repeat-containing protein